MKKLFAAFIAACLAVIAVSTASIAIFQYQATRYEAMTIYATAAFAAKIDDNTVTFEDSDGNQWTVDGAEDWEAGDLAVMMMHDGGTPEDLTDDVILSAEYSGFGLPD